MSDRLKKFWFLLKSYFFAFAMQVIALYLWDWYVPTQTWGYNLPRWVHWVFGTFVFIVAHFIQVVWHAWRENRKTKHATPTAQ